VKFIVDAQLPQSLAIYLQSRGYDTIHTITLPEKNKTKDGSIIALSISEDRIIISKDTDFLGYHILKREPRKLLTVKTGNIRNSELIDLFGKNLDSIVEHFKTHSLIELHQTEIIIHQS